MTFKRVPFCLLLVLVVLSHSFMADASQQSKILPDKFIGSFKLDRSENFDEFLASKGTGFLFQIAFSPLQILNF